MGLWPDSCLCVFVRWWSSRKASRTTHSPCWPRPAAGLCSLTGSLYVSYQTDSSIERWRIFNRKPAFFPWKSWPFVTGDRPEQSPQSEDVNLPKTREIQGGFSTVLQFDPFCVLNKWYTAVCSSAVAVLFRMNSGPCLAKRYYLILSYLILSYLILSYLILCTKMMGLCRCWRGSRSRSSRTCEER